MFTEGQTHQMEMSQPTLATVDPKEHVDARTTIRAVERQQLIHLAIDIRMDFV